MDFLPHPPLLHYRVPITPPPNFIDPKSSSLPPSLFLHSSLVVTAPQPSTLPPRPLAQQPLPGNLIPSKLFTPSPGPDRPPGRGRLDPLVAPQIYPLLTARSSPPSLVRPPVGPVPATLDLGAGASRYRTEERVRNSNRRNRRVRKGRGVGEGREVLP